MRSRLIDEGSGLYRDLLQHDVHIEYSKARFGCLEGLASEQATPLAHGVIATAVSLYGTRER